MHDTLKKKKKKNPFKKELYPKQKLDMLCVLSQIFDT